jgi:RNA polymerase subunit RPABC4/transcription elongation factor Spt4
MDSSDFLKCDCKCGYEICLISECLGPESGLYSCKKGHVFCKNCADKKLIKDIEDCYDHEGYDAAKDWVKKDLCPICKSKSTTKNTKAAR